MRVEFLPIVTSVQLGCEIFQDIISCRFIASFGNGKERQQQHGGCSSGAREGIYL